MCLFNVKRIASLFVLWSAVVTVFAAQSQDTTRYSGPIIDMHMHAGPGSTESEVYGIHDGETPDEARLRTFFADMDANEVVLGIVVGPPAYVEIHRQPAPDRLIGGITFPCTEGRSPNLYRCFEEGGDWPDLGKLRTMVEAGRIGALGELYNVYAGVSPLDARMEPYYGLAVEHNLLVLTHAEQGPPPEGRTPGCCPHFEGDYGDPALYTDVLERYPELKLVLYHAFRPEFVESAIRLMDAYPGVMVETSPMTIVPAFLVHAAIRRYTEAGHGDRIVFGSDYLGSIGEAIQVIEEAPISSKLKRDILYNNAARFLNLSEEEIARHHESDNHTTEN